MPVPKHRLGTPFYSVSRVGEITLLVITQLPFTLPSGHFWSAGVAAARARKNTAIALETVDSKSQEQKLRERLQALDGDREAYFAALEPKEHRGLSSSITSMILGGAQLPELMVSEIPHDDMLLKPRTKVWIPITPDSHNTMSGGFRPEPYFVLETYIKNVSWKAYVWTNGWRLFYDIDSRYSSWDNSMLHTSKTAAVAHLCRLLEAQTPARALPEKVRIYRRHQEKSHDRKKFKAITEQYDRVHAAQ